MPPANDQLFIIRAFLAGQGLLLSLAAAADGAAVALTQQIPDIAAVVAGMPPQPLLDGARPAADRINFSIGVEFQCGAGSTRRQIFVAVADTTRMSDVSRTPSPVAVQIDVPLQQLRWLDPPAACHDRESKTPAATGPSGERYFLVRGRALAYATVSCAVPGRDPAMASATTPLDLWLQCPANAPPAEAPPEPPADAAQQGTNRSGQPGRRSLHGGSG